MHAKDAIKFHSFDATLAASYGLTDPTARRAAEANVPVEWKVGNVIMDTYEVTGILGEGGMGKVYKVHHRGWEIDLAVKSPKSEIFSQEGGQENFMREAETWVNLGLHPHTVSCYYVRTLGNVPRVFAEYVEGGSLEDWIRSGKLYEGGKEKALERILDIAIQFARGLHYAHEQGLVHQDVKPQNVMMTPDGIAKVTDFGLAKARAMAGEKSPVDGRQSILVSTSGMTPAYCSPEQAAGQKLTYKTDIWSWGVTIMEMFAGEVTWLAGQAAAEALESQLGIELEDATIPLIPVALSDLLRQCFKKKPQERPRNMEEISGALQYIYQQEIGQSYSRPMLTAIELQADTLNNRALSMLDLGKEDQAVACWEEALKLDQQHPDSTLNYSYYQWQRGSLDELSLLSTLSKVAAACAGNPDYHYHLSLIYLDLGEAEEAKKSAEVAAKTCYSKQEELEAFFGEKQYALQCIHVFDRFEYYEAEFLTYSPDGKYVLCSCEEQDNRGQTILKLIDVRQGRCIGNFDVHIKRGYSSENYLVTSFLPKGRSFISGEEDGTLKLWDVDKCKSIRSFSGHKKAISSCAVSTDGRYFVTGSLGDKTIRLWDVTKEECAKFLSQDSGGRSFFFTPDGKYLVVITDDSELIYDTEKWECCKNKLLPEIFQDKRIVFSPDGRYIVSSDYIHLGLFALHSLDIEDCSHVRTFRGHWSERGRIRWVCFSYDSKYIVSGNDDGRISIWDVHNGICVKSFGGKGRSDRHNIRSLALSPDGQYLFSTHWCDPMGYGRDYSTVKQWRVTFEAFYHFIVSMPISAVRMTEIKRVAEETIKNSRALISSGAFAKAYAALQRVRKLQGFERHSEVLELSNQCGLKAGRRKRLLQWWIAKTLPGHSDDVNTAAFSPDGEYFATAGSDNTIRVWERKSGSCVQTIGGCPRSISNVVFSPDGNYIFSSEYMENPETRQWDIRSGKCVRTFNGHKGGTRSLVVSPNGEYLLSGGSGEDNFEIWLWDVAHGEKIHAFSGHRAPVTSKAFSPNGKLMVSGSEDGTIRIWSINAKRCMKIYKTRNKRIGSCYGSNQYYEEYWDSTAFSFDLNYALCNGSSLEFWNLVEGVCLKNLESPMSSSSVDDIQFFPQSNPFALLALKSHPLRINKEYALVFYDLCSREYYVVNMDTELNCIAISPDCRYAVTGSSDHMVRLWEFDWDYEFPALVDWDEKARPYLEIFLSSHIPYGQDRIGRVDLFPWTEKDFQQLLNELGFRGYGWLRPEGIRQQLEKMVSEPLVKDDADVFDIPDETVMLQAIEEFRFVNSIEEMRHVVSQYPFLVTPAFIQIIGQVGPHIPLQQKAIFEQRITWLLQIAAEGEVIPQQQALEAFELANSVSEMQQVVSQYPFIAESDFILAVEKIIPEMPPNVQPLIKERLTWLKQISEKKKNTQGQLQRRTGFFDRLRRKK